MIDRPSRNKTVDAIKKYMSEEISAFEFDDLLWGINTEDKTIQEIISLLWYYYDDCKDHKIVADKETWDLFNRLLLLLESDGELHMEKKKRMWTMRNFIAFLSLISFVLIVIKTGWGEHLLIFSIPFGIVSMILTRFNVLSEKKRLKSNTSIAPFSSFHSLRLVRNRIPTFKKVKYPNKLSKRKIRNIVFEKIFFLPARIAWLMFAPIVLFFQVFPIRETETTVKIPEQIESPNQLSAIAPS